jgi:hypothetical protein
MVEYGFGWMLNDGKPAFREDEEIVREPVG